jgi:hypothetical protein
MRIRTAATILLGAALIVTAGQSPASARTATAGQLPAVSPSVAAGSAHSFIWSGYAVVACGSCHLRYVAADWTLPRLDCANSPDQSWIAWWVGLDGWTTGSIEQAGVFGNCAAGAAYYYLFTEMYPAPSRFVLTAAGPGDRMGAAVYFDRASGLWHLSLTDATVGARVAVVAACPPRAYCYNKSAEVVTEAPCCALSGAPLALADFGRVTYSGARVTSYNGTRGALAGSSLWRSYALTLVDARGAVESYPGPLASGTAAGVPVSSFTGYWVASS